ncbi:hypothetical protein CVT25_002140 [Psilocybe cyanescens]|uniref:Uncharacterized protein n=1 Tax=Psilocybe cyanescens TaxID=93625 RepID=A0A409X4H4_PSICY|nr:hypothetical protein CVT25_002140 [Psilocybe cyanescens]
MNVAPVGFVYPSSSLAGTAPRFLGGFISMYYCLTVQFKPTTGGMSSMPYLLEKLFLYTCNA